MVNASLARLVCLGWTYATEGADTLFEFVKHTNLFCSNSMTVEGGEVRISFSSVAFSFSVLRMSGPPLLIAFAFSFGVTPIGVAFLFLYFFTIGLSPLTLHLGSTRDAISIHDPRGRNIKLIYGKFLRTPWTGSKPKVFLGTGSNMVGQSRSFGIKGTTKRTR